MRCRRGGGAVPERRVRAHRPGLRRGWRACPNRKAQELSQVFDAPTVAAVKSGQALRARLRESNQKYNQEAAAASQTDPQALDLSTGPPGAESKTNLSLFRNDLFWNSYFMNHGMGPSAGSTARLTEHQPWLELHRERECTVS